MPEQGAQASGGAKGAHVRPANDQGQEDQPKAAGEHATRKEQVADLLPDIVTTSASSEAPAPLTAQEVASATSTVSAQATAPAQPAAQAPAQPAAQAPAQPAAQAPAQPAAQAPAASDVPDDSAESRHRRPDAIQSKPAAAAGGAKPAIVFDHVTKIYDAQPDKPALDDVSLAVYPGEFVFLVGHSGSGKSTFIRLINRELKVTDGNLYVAGENLSTISRRRVPYLRRNIGCVFQDFKLLPMKTTFENVAFALEVIGKSKSIINQQVPEVLRLVGLEGKLDKYPDQLSGGEQQRVSIARAIVNRPPLLICDEPTGNLDPQTSLGIMRLLDRINRTGTIVVVATHDKEMVNSMRRRVIALDGGRIVSDQDKGVYDFDA